MSRLWNRAQIPLRWIIHGIFFHRIVLMLFPDYIGNRLNKSAENEYYEIIKKEFGLNTKKREKKIIISLTTIPTRINKIKLVVSRMMSQTILPDEINLYIDSSQKEQFLFDDDLQNLIRLGLKINFVRDIGPHTKYFYALQNYRNDIVITIDDDIIYSHKLIETLIDSYKKYPNKISANIVTNYVFGKNGELLSSLEWRQKLTYGVGKRESIAYGVGGVLYPPYTMPDETFDEKKIRELCLFADDLWLKVIENKYNIEVVKAKKSDRIFGFFVTVDGSQEISLRSKNDFEDRNVIYLKKLIKLEEE